MAKVKRKVRPTQCSRMLQRTGEHYMFPTPSLHVCCSEQILNDHVHFWSCQDKVMFLIMRVHMCENLSWKAILSVAYVHKNKAQFAITNI
jgi:hypothetical protein